jgi:hypothetical protein
MHTRSNNVIFHNNKPIWSTLVKTAFRLHTSAKRLTGFPSHFARFCLLVHAGTAKADGSVEKKSSCTSSPPSIQTLYGTLPNPFPISTLHHINSTNEFCYLTALLSTSSITESMFCFRVIWLASYFFLLCACTRI